MKTRSALSGATQLSVSVLKALIGTGGIPRHVSTVRGDRPFLRQKRRKLSLLSNWCANSASAIASNALSVDESAR